MNKYSVMWGLPELRQTKPVKVFSIFSCGGGSSMGYERAGFEVIGNCEIDPRINAFYKTNLHPRLSFEMDARDFAAKCERHEVPAELYELDVLDGSPPCTTFSMAGTREKSWGKTRKFREGQTAQTLDDLFFTYIAIAKALQPKVCVAENVKGLLAGKAAGYVNLIIKAFDEAGYALQIFLLNSAFMDVPQQRERVFFIARRKDLNLDNLTLEFDHDPVPFKEVKGGTPGKALTPGTKLHDLIDAAVAGEPRYRSAHVRLYGRDGFFTNAMWWDNYVPGALTSSGSVVRADDREWATPRDMQGVSTFPVDYNFLGAGRRMTQFICGMSVPPNMMANIADELWQQWFSKLTR